MNRRLAGLLAIAVSTTAAAQGAQAALKTEDEKTIYALGVAMAKSAKEMNLTKAEFELLKRGLNDEFTGGKVLVNWDEYRNKIGQLAESRRGAASAAAEKPVLDKYSKEKGAQPQPSGLIYFEQKAGTGPSPKETDTVKVHYRGTLPDGTEFDSSYSRNEPTEFPLNGVIKCWTEGVKKMKVGGKARLVCPSSIAYGPRSPSPKIPANATLVFEIELLEIKGAAPKPK